MMWAVALVGAAGPVLVAVGASAPQGAVPGVCSGGWALCQEGGTAGTRRCRPPGGRHLRERERETRRPKATARPWAASVARSPALRRERRLDLSFRSLARRLVAWSAG
ncbi:hypothetical protein ACPA9J_11350 [Pseudomonas aeruginosa]